MPTSDLTTLYCRFVESVNRRSLDHLDQFLAPDVVEHAPDRSVGLEASRQRLVGWLSAVPDAHLVIEDLVVERDHLMARLRATGTPGGIGAGRPTGRQPSVVVFETWSVRDGRCVERWVHVDRSQCPAGELGPETNDHSISVSPGRPAAARGVAARPGWQM
jgi:predicted ester cyclase